MALFLAAHGFDPGPSQRPYLAGAISGLLATLPATGVLVAFSSLSVESKILGLSPLATIAAGWAIMAAAGAVYARFFGRAANYPRGGWLFGMTYGFALWAAGAVLILPLVSGGHAPAGPAAAGVALSLLVWGLTIGILVPFVHRPLHEDLDKASKRTEIGPDAAAAASGLIRGRKERPKS